ncbi:MAG: type II toxin-antitoxin system VapC family toxin [Blastocatellia bacterium]
MSIATGSSYVADTHIVIWVMSKPSLLSPASLSAVQAAESSGDPIYVSAITIVELRYLVEKGKLTEADYQECLKRIVDPANVLTIAPLDLRIADMLSQIPRAVVPDMPDRIIAATGLALGLPLITADHKIRSLTNITTIW